MNKQRLMALLLLRHEATGRSASDWPMIFFLLVLIWTATYIATLYVFGFIFIGRTSIWSVHDEKVSRARHVGILFNAIFCFLLFTPTFHLPEASAIMKSVLLALSLMATPIYISCVNYSINFFNKKKPYKISVSDLENIVKCFLLVLIIENV